MPNTGRHNRKCGRRWRSRPTSTTSSTCPEGGRIRPRSDSDGAADRSLWTRCPEASGGFGVQPQQAFSQGENGKCGYTCPACHLARPPKPPFLMGGHCLGRAPLRPVAPHIIMALQRRKIFLKFFKNLSPNLPFSSLYSRVFFTEECFQRHKPTPTQSRKRGIPANVL